MMWRNPYAIILHYVELGRNFPQIRRILISIDAGGFLKLSRHGIYQLQRSSDTAVKLDCNKMNIESLKKGPNKTVGDRD